MGEQLALGIQLRDDARLENFTIGRNAELLKQIELALAGQGERFFYLWGKEGVGLTHLLQASCRVMGAKGLPIVYLPLNRYADFSPELLDEFDSLALICIDDLDEIAGQKDWEEALFHLYNRVKLGSSLLFVTGHSPPAQMKLGMPDLTSRLSWRFVFQVHDLSDEEKIATLIQCAEKRGLFLPETVANFLLTRFSRNMKNLIAALDKLDQMSLAEQRRLTIPFVKYCLYRH